MVTWSFDRGWLVHDHGWGHWGFFPYSLSFTSGKTSGFVHMLGAEFQEENLLPFLKSATMIMAESSLLDNGGCCRQDWFTVKREWELEM